MNWKGMSIVVIYNGFTHTYITNNESCVYDDVSYTEGESDENHYTAEEVTNNSYTDE